MKKKEVGEEDKKKIKTEEKQFTEVLSIPKILQSILSSREKCAVLFFAYYLHDIFDY